MTATSSAQSILAAFSTFEEHVTLVERHLARGQLDAAAVHAEIAAAHAHWQHSGIFASHRLEAACSALAERVAARRPSGRRARDRKTAGAPQRVLHVLTQATGIGGHTRMVWRWIAADRTRSHSIALTRQGPIDVPMSLTLAAHESGGAIHVLNRRPGRIPSWANRLRDLSMEFDLVVLHVFAGDLVAFLAFADRRGRPPTAYVDQSDHAFWLGRSYVDVLVSLRRTGQALAHTRRGFAESGTALLPIPIQDLPRRVSRAEAKRGLGIGSDDLVALTVARGLKFRPVGGRHFLDTVVPVLQSRRNVVLLAVGPDEDGRWQEAARQTDGRVHAIGTRADTDAYREAADVYLDSYPIVSTTSLLESGTYGIPLLTRCPHAEGCDVFCADAPGLDRSMLRARADDDHAGLLDRLLSNADLRAEAGAAVAADVRTLHCGDGWLRALEDLYVRAMEVSPVRLGRSPRREPLDEPRTTRLNLLGASLYNDRLVLESVGRAMIRALPARQRASAWIELRTAVRRTSLGLLLPEWLHAQLRRFFGVVLGRTLAARLWQRARGGLAARLSSSFVHRSV